MNATETAVVARELQLRALASMGPSRECDGDAGYPDHPRWGSYEASMGPSRECDGDEVAAFLARAKEAAASMGPSRECDGDGASRSLTTPTRKLQWGRRVNATETLPIMLLYIIYKNHASMGPSRECDGDRPATARVPSRAGTASMGPSRECDGDPCGAAGSTSGTSRASMGPSRECDGDQIQCTSSRGHRWLQWGRRVNATETG